jgi:hypothetical protein
MSGAIRAAAVGLGGVVLAWLWFGQHEVWVVVLILGPILPGLALYRRGTLFLPHRPVQAVRWMGALVLVPAGVALGAATALIVLGAAVEPPEDWSVEQQKLLAAIAGAITALLTPLMAGGDEAKGFESWVGSRIQTLFHEAYNSETGAILFPQNDPAEQAVFSDPWTTEHSGWGRRARAARAEVVQRAIDEGRGREAPKGGES